VTSLLRRLAGSEATESRFSLNDYLQLLNYGGTGYPLIQGGTPGGKAEVVQNSFTGYVQGMYQRNGVVFACMAARMLLFSEARFQFRRMVDGRPGDLFGTQDLALLETPWAGRDDRGSAQPNDHGRRPGGERVRHAPAERADETQAGLGDDHLGVQDGPGDRYGADRLPVSPDRLVCG
jgi:hypothetical protein